MMPPSGAQIMEYWARPTARVRGSLDERVGEAVARARPADPQLAHVGQVEQAGRAADLGVLLEDAPVLDGHRPAAEVDEPRAQRHDAPRGAGVWRSCRATGVTSSARGSARATTSRSVGKLMRSGRPSTETQRTSSNSWSWSDRSPPTGSIR